LHLFKGNTEKRDKKNVAISEGYGSILVYGSMCCALTETENKICFGHIFNLVLFTIQPQPAYESTGSIPSSDYRI